MPSISAIRKANVASSPKYTPVAVFVGGTSGIGGGMAEVFGRHVHGNADIVIVGRSRAAAESVLASIPQPHDRQLKREFIQCDVTRMKNVQAASKEILSKYPKVNFLVLSTGVMTMKGRDETEEGIDTKLAVHYYARWKFINELLPGLNRASEAGEDAKVFSALAAGQGGEIDLDDLGLKKTFSVKAAALQAPTYTDLMMEEFFARNPNLTFVHSYPGVVRTSLLQKSDTTLLKLMHPVVNTLMRPLLTSPEDCGEYMWHAIYNSNKGAFRTNSHGEDIGKERYFGSDDARKKLWEHTVQVTTVQSE